MQRDLAKSSVSFYILQFPLGKSTLLSIFNNIMSASSIAPGHSKMYNLVCVPSEDLDQPAHPRNLIRVFVMRSVGSQGCKMVPLTLCMMGNLCFCCRLLTFFSKITFSINSFKNTFRPSNVPF